MSDPEDLEFLVETVTRGKLWWKVSLLRDGRTIDSTIARPHRSERKQRRNIERAKATLRARHEFREQAGGPRREPWEEGR